MLKMVIVVRTDLGMSCGKIAGQVGHASVRAYVKAKSLNKIFWVIDGESKIVLKVNSEEELLEIMKRCKEHDLSFVSVRDAGRTQISTNTLTCIGICPDLEERIDKVTGNLKLL